MNTAREATSLAVANQINSPQKEASGDGMSVTATNDKKKGFLDDYDDWEISADPLI